MGRNKTSTESKQPLGFVEIAGFGGVEDGKAKAELSTSVNQGIKAPAWTHTDKAFHKRVTFNEEELGAARDAGQMKAYSKQVDAVQEDADTTTPNSTSSPVTGFGNEQVPTSSEGSPSGLQVLKNFVDHIDDRLTKYSLAFGIGFILLAVAVAALYGAQYL